MIKWLRSRFSLAEQGKISEKVFLSRITLNITVIVICMIAMAITAFAYFSADIYSQNNRIQAAHFDVEIHVTSMVGDNAVTESVNHQSAAVYLVNMKADTVYAVEIIAKGNANTGFVVISAGGYQYHTEQLVLDDKTSIVLYLKPIVDIEVMLMPHWGTSSHYEAFSSGDSDLFYLQDDPNGMCVKDLPVYEP